MTFFGGRLFKGGVYTREAFITKYRKVTILYINVNDFVVSFYAKRGIICFINVGICDQIERVKDDQVRLTRRAVISTAPYHFDKVQLTWNSESNNLPNHSGGVGLFEGGVYKIIWEKGGRLFKGGVFSR